MNLFLCENEGIRERLRTNQMTKPVLLCVLQVISIEDNMEVTQ